MMIDYFLFNKNLKIKMSEAEIERVDLDSMSRKKPSK